MNSIRHVNWYTYWRTHERNYTATAEEFQRSKTTILKYAGEEDWVANADRDDAAAAAKYTQTHEQHKAAALAQAYDVVQVMLANAGKMQVEIMQRLATGQADAMDIGAAGAYAARAIQCADTVYSISKINLAVEDTRPTAPGDALVLSVITQLREQGLGQFADASARA